MAEYGIYTFTLSVIGVLIAGTALGLPQSIIYYIGRKEITFREIISVIIILWSIFSFLIFILIYFFTDQILNLFSGFNNPILLILVLVIFMIKLFDYLLNALIRAYQFFSFFNIRRVAESVVFILFIFIAVLLSEQNVIGFLLIYTTISALSLGLLFFFLYRKNPEGRGAYGLKPDKVKKLLTFGSKSYLQNLMGFLNYQMSVLFLALLMDSWNVGIYSVAVSIASMILFIPDTLGTVFLPYLTSLKNDQEIHQATASILRNMLVILFLGIVILFLIGKLIIHYLYGINYMPSYYPMMIIFPGMIFLSLYKILTRNFTSRNKQHYSIIVSLSTLFINVPLNIILIKQFGIYGAVFASTLSFIFAGIFLLSYFKIQSGMSLKEILVIKKEDIQFYKKLVLDYKTKLAGS